MGFAFEDPPVMTDGELELVCIWTKDGDPKYQTVATYELEIRRAGVRVGRIGFRCEPTHYMTTYAGNIGYAVEEHARGHHYAARAIGLLRPFMRRYLTTAWITIDPDNVASRRTAERAGAVFVEIVDLLPEDEQYKDGERQKCRYRLEL
ncbi:MAG TPA: GNAT family N-acetyltransferase [Kofleriaceae bacterium]